MVKGVEWAFEIPIRWFQRAAGYVGRMFMGEALEIFGAVVGTAYGIARGLYGMGKGIVTGSFGTFARGVGDTLSAAVMLRSGSASGLGWPGRGGQVTPHTGTRLNGASRWHDGQSNLTQSASPQFGWIQRAWTGSGVEMGPWGQAYRLYGTVGFGILGAGQAAAGSP